MLTETRISIPEAVDEFRELMNEFQERVKEAVDNIKVLPDRIRLVNSMLLDLAEYGTIVLCDFSLVRLLVDHLPEGCTISCRGQGDGVWVVTLL